MLDLLIVAATAGFALLGLRRGFVVSLFSLLGFLIGAVVSTALAGVFLPPGRRSLATPVFGLFAALLGGGTLGVVMGELGARLRARHPSRFPGRADGPLGAVLSGCIVLGVAWMLGAVALAVPRDSLGLRQAVQRSAALRGLDALLPAPAGVLRALEPFDPLPALQGPQAEIARPTRQITRSTAVRRAAASVVRVLGSACGTGLEGSGWVAAPGVVVTNAHVVAGESDTVVLTAAADSPEWPAEILAFDTQNDIAVLRVRGLDLPALPLAVDPPAGRAAAILGYPHNGPLDVRSGRIGATISRRAPNAFGRGAVDRLLTPLRGLVRPGNSGGPMVDARGRVVATVVAETFGGGILGGYGVANPAVVRALAGALAPVPDGPCHT
ncbi:MAG: CvpA family protein [Solirubrobacteraceae bacterium]